MSLPEHNPDAFFHEPPHAPKPTTDVGEACDVLELHASTALEAPSSASRPEATPVWFFILCALALFWAGAYLAQYSGGFRGNVFDETAIAYGPGAVARSADAAVKNGAANEGVAAALADDPVALGKRFFSANCVACHQATGTGVAGQYPPLAKSPYVNGPAKPLMAIVLDGLQGPVDVEGANFNGQMPAWGPVLTDKKIAYILTYIRQEWGNKADPVKPEEVAAMRAGDGKRPTPWTIAEVKNLK